MSNLNSFPLCSHIGVQDKKTGSYNFIPCVKPILKSKVRSVDIIEPTNLIKAITMLSQHPAAVEFKFKKK